MAITFPHAAAADLRPVVRCRHCRLNQFATLSGNCRKCGGALQPEDSEETCATETGGVEELTVTSADVDICGRLASRVRGIREARSMTQYQLAARMRCLRTYISKVERGHALPTLPQILRFANALDVPVVYLLGEREPYAALVLEDRWVEEISELIAEMDEDQRSTVMESIREMCDGRRRRRKGVAA